MTVGLAEREGVGWPVRTTTGWSVGNREKTAEASVKDVVSPCREERG